MSLYLPAQTQSLERVMLLALPADFDVPGWRLACAEADEHTQQILSPEIDLLGTVMRTEITYPHLLAATAPKRDLNIGWRDSLSSGRLALQIQRVYIGWRGATRFWQQTANVGELEREHLAGMWPGWANLMQVGSPYLWVFATPHDCHPYTYPESASATRMGWLNPEQGEPVWL